MPKLELPQARPSDVGFDPARLSRLATVLAGEVEAGRIPGAVVAVARRGRRVLLEAVGHRDPETRHPMPADAVFSIASMTKPMTSVAILQLLEEGRLLLADPVSRFLPELAGLRVAAAGDGPLETRPARREPTIHDLLRHTSGLTYQDRGSTPAHAQYPGSSISACVKLSREGFLSALADAPLLFEPGTGWEYGFSTDLLGLIVERINGKTLAESLRERIWQPLGMSDTGFPLTPETTPRYARALPKDPLTGAAQVIHHATGRPTQWDSGGGGAVSTAADYLRFAEALRQGGALASQRLLGRKTVALMTADHLPASFENRVADAMDPASTGYGFGLGVAVRRQDGNSALVGTAGDYYWSGVYGTYFWVDPKEELSCVFMAAAPGLMRLRYRQLVRALVYQSILD